MPTRHADAVAHDESLRESERPAPFTCWVPQHALEHRALRTDNALIFDRRGYVLPGLRVASRSRAIRDRRLLQRRRGGCGGRPRGRSSRSAAGSSRGDPDGEPEPEPGPPPRRLELLPPRAVMTFALLDAERRGAEVEGVR